MSISSFKQAYLDNEGKRQKTLEEIAKLEDTLDVDFNELVKNELPLLYKALEIYNESARFFLTKNKEEAENSFSEFEHFLHSIPEDDADFIRAVMFYKHKHWLEIETRIKLVLALA